MTGVVFQRLPSGAWSAHREGILLAAEAWADEDQLAALLALGSEAAFKIIDVPEGDRLGQALLALGWSKYATQIEMIRRV
jgi:hypothetical protein